MCFSGSALDSSSLVPGSILAARAARTGSSGAAAPAKEVAWMEVCWIGGLD